MCPVPKVILAPPEPLAQPGRKARKAFKARKAMLDRPERLALPGRKARKAWPAP